MRDRASADPDLFPNPLSTSERPPAPDLRADGPDGHHVDHQHRDYGFGSVLIHNHVPVKGMSGFSDPQSHISFTHEPPDNRWNQSSHQGASMAKLPKLPFPVFVGENPKL